ncbi:MAG: NUDIX hydrolase [Polyangiaceae bacterium]|nr:NUDIX hydrolase [Polyangiaceae bacterium]MBK8938305.1 NUDIX hydrolase [Polyangiaceae bacterium]
MAAPRPRPKAETKPRKRAEAEEDAAFLSSYDPARYERPSVAVDVALLTASEDALFTLVVRRSEPPQRDRWALPGAFVRMDESLDETAARVLEEKVGLERVFLEQLYTFGAPRRDPRTRVVSVAYYALVAKDRIQLGAASDARRATIGRIDVPWEHETGGPVLVADEAGAPLDLAFDHAEILGMAVKRIRGKLDYSPIGFQLLAERFTLLELQRVHETVLSRPLNKDSFRRRMLASGQLEATGESQRGVDHRPAELYRFARRSAI